MEAFIEFRTGALGHTANAVLASDGKTVEVAFTFHPIVYTFDAKQFFDALAKIEDECFENYIKADHWFAMQLLKHLVPLKQNKVIV